MSLLISGKYCLLKKLQRVGGSCSFGKTFELIFYQLSFSVYLLLLLRVSRIFNSIAKSLFNDEMQKNTTILTTLPVISMKGIFTEVDNIDIDMATLN